METKKSHKIIIPKKGIATGSNNPRAVYDPVTSAVIGALGTTETQRASHVEPGSGLSQEAFRALSTTRVDVINLATSTSKKHSIKSEFSSHWFADMTPTGHDVVLGPYPPDQRDQALADEVKWLHEHNIPTCGTCTEKKEDTVVDS